MKNDPKTPNLPCIRCHEKEARDGGAMCWDCTHVASVNGVGPRGRTAYDLGVDRLAKVREPRDEAWTSIGTGKYINRRGFNA